MTSIKNSKKTSGPQQVTEFLSNLEHPQKEAIEIVRNIILSVNPAITEHIKWNAPSFCIGNEDRITFNLHSDGFFRLIFHCGAKGKDSNDKGPLFVDITGLLEWVTDNRAIVTFTEQEVEKDKEEKRKQVVARWMEMTLP